MVFLHYESFLISESQLSSPSVKGFYPSSDNAFSLFFPIFCQSIRVNELTNIIGGHPYLIQSAFKTICDQNLSLKELLEKAPTEEGIYRDHLRQKLLTLEQYPELKDAFKKVISQENPIRLESVLAYKLEALGLVVFRENKVTIRNDLYRLYFQDILFTS